VRNEIAMKNIMHLPVRSAGAFADLGRGIVSEVGALQTKKIKTIVGLIKQV
jgi:hypothetical protein